MDTDVRRGLQQAPHNATYLPRPLLPRPVTPSPHCAHRLSCCPSKRPCDRPLHCSHCGRRARLLLSTYYVMATVSKPGEHRTGH